MDPSILHNPIFLFLVFFVALVWFLTNALTVIGMVGANKDNLMKRLGGEDKSMDELHKRVEELEKKRDDPL